MAQVADDYPVMCQGDIYPVTQPWKGPDPVVTAVPQNEELCQKLRDILLRCGEVTYLMRDGYYEIEGVSCPNG